MHAFPDVNIPNYSITSLTLRWWKRRVSWR